MASGGSRAGTGGLRPGAGRKPGPASDRGRRPVVQLRLYEEEEAAVKALQALMKRHPSKIPLIMAVIEEIDKSPSI